MVLSKKATRILVLTVTLLVSAIIFPALILTSNSRESSLLASTNSDEIAYSDSGEQTTTDLPSDIPSSSPSDVPSCIRTASVQKRIIGSDYPSLIPSSEPTVNVVSDYPSLLPSARETPESTIDSRRLALSDKASQ
jgi:hypothetical protein